MNYNEENEEEEIKLNKEKEEYINEIDKIEGELNENDVKK